MTDKKLHSYYSKSSILSENQKQRYTRAERLKNTGNCAVPHSLKYLHNRILSRRVYEILILLPSVHHSPLHFLAFLDV